MTESKPMTDPMELVGRATEASDLHERIMNPNVAKSEAEWWASREIERLEACIREMVEFNVNNTVWIKVTENGRQVEADHWASFGVTLPEPRVDAGGWEARQLWDVMSVFGRALSCGGPVPFETTIRLAPPAPGAEDE